MIRSNSLPYLLVTLKETTLLHELKIALPHALQCHRRLTCVLKQRLLTSKQSDPIPKKDIFQSYHLLQVVTAGVPAINSTVLNNPLDTVLEHSSIQITTSAMCVMKSCLELIATS